MLQPRGAQPSWPSGPVPTPSFQPVVPTGDAGATSVATPSPTQNTTLTPAGDLSQDICEMASRNMLIAAGGYVLGATLLGTAVFLLMRKKLWSTVAGRYITAVLVAALASGSLMYFDPARVDDLVRCLHNPDLARYIVLGTGQAARALVLGLLPAFVLTSITCVVANRT